ncbi:MAG: 1-acyl-sn-glycerol-3-phosphate acyltransferase [Candidatus Omnitrophica bacterium]|nr:1-acyl-sn-glycerol-3-phosphate acyltransferase [Candidatus Omnitrophota bacterium]
MLYWIVRHAVFILTKILCRLEVSGSENIPEYGRFIMASNHCSHLDPPIIVSSVLRKMHFLSKAELFRGKFFEGFFKGCNCIKLDRNGIGRSALKEGVKVLQRGRGLALFPEGRRSLDGNMGAGKGGVAVFAFASNAPVFPVYIEGSRRALPPKSAIIRLFKVRVRIGKAFYAPKDFDKSNRKQAYQEFTERIMREISQLAKEATKNS